VKSRVQATGSSVTLAAHAVDDYGAARTKSPCRALLSGIASMEPLLPSALIFWFKQVEWILLVEYNLYL
jgi:hypothetical protein